jgi:imidazolonepropionase-like amidohydrolase
MHRFLTCLLFLVVPSVALPQAQSLSPRVRSFVSVDAPVVALTGVRVIDGTGAAPVENQVLIIRDGRIAAVGNATEVEIPAAAEVLDLTGRSVLPGMVMLHEHMFYPAGGGAYNQQTFSFPRLYLAGGVTTIRTAAAINPYADLNLKRNIEAGQTPGPRIDVTGPFLNGPGVPILEMRVVDGPEDARRVVSYWADEGVDSFKAYTMISRAELGAAIDEAHIRGAKFTAHLCSVTYREAAELGVDNLEHGFMVSSDFVADKVPDECPSSSSIYASLQAVDINGPEFQDLVQTLVSRGVALTSTLPVIETFTPGRPPASNGALDAMATEAREQYLRRRAQIAVDQDSHWNTLFWKLMEMERAFVEAGGLLVTGTDPTGYGGVVAGFSNWRAVELHVESGFTPLEAIRIATLNGAEYLDMDDRIGSIAVGKLADLVVVRGNPAANIDDIENVELVFKGGIGFDSPKLFESVKGTVGIR